MNEENKTFEQNLRRLEEIVRAMERGDVALEESLKLFQEGTELVRSWRQAAGRCGAAGEAGAVRTGRRTGRGGFCRWRTLLRPGPGNTGIISSNF